MNLPPGASETPVSPSNDTDSAPERADEGFCSRGVCTRAPCICVIPRPISTFSSRIKVSLYMFRHGQTAFNAAGILQGQIDVPLSAAGRQQARAAGRVLAARGVYPHAFITSDLCRASGTAHYLAAAWRNAVEMEAASNGDHSRVHVPPLYLLQDLRERGLGCLEGRLASEVRTSLGTCASTLADEPAPAFMHYVDRVAAEHPHLGIELGSSLQGRVLRGVLGALRVGLAASSAIPNSGQRVRKRVDRDAGPGGLHAALLESRARGALARVLASGRESIPLVIVMHGQALRAALGALLLPQTGQIDTLRGRPIHFPTEAANCALTHVTLEVPTEILSSQFPPCESARAIMVSRAGIDRPPNLGKGLISRLGLPDGVTPSSSPPPSAAAASPAASSAIGATAAPAPQPQPASSLHHGGGPASGGSSPRGTGSRRLTQLARIAALERERHRAEALPSESDIEKQVTLWASLTRTFKTMRPMLLALNQFGAGYASMPTPSFRPDTDAYSSAYDTPLSSSATDDDHTGEVGGATGPLPAHASTAVPVPSVKDAERAFVLSTLQEQQSQQAPQPAATGASLPPAAVSPDRRVGSAPRELGASPASFQDPRLLTTPTGLLPGSMADAAAVAVSSVGVSGVDEYSRLGESPAVGSTSSRRRVGSMGSRSLGRVSVNLADCDGGLPTPLPCEGTGNATEGTPLVPPIQSGGEVGGEGW